MLEKAMIELGLSDKEAKVYLASLELGPSTAQIISTKANVNRATTYVVIESLMEMGLMSTYDEGKKTFFSAESPERLLEFLRNQERQASDKINLLKEKMPEIRSLVNASGNKSETRYFEGVEEMKIAWNDLWLPLDTSETVYTFLSLDEYHAADSGHATINIPSEGLEKNIAMKIIYASKNGKQMRKERGINSLEFICINHDQYPFHGRIDIGGERIIFTDYLGKLSGMVVKNKNLAQTLESIFRALWDNYKK